MATRLVPGAERGSFLLEPLCFAGWRARVQDGRPPTIRARRDDVALEVAGAGLAGAAGIAVARAMRSSDGGASEDV